MSYYEKFDRKFRIRGKLIFETAFHVGSGKEGDLATNMGVLKNVYDEPILPGSTLKGSFRSSAERLAPHLGLTACLLDSDLSGIECVTGTDNQQYQKTIREKVKRLDSESKKLGYLQGHTCDVCRLFGSPMQASRIFFSDGDLKGWAKVFEIRDGVCLDRDSETARHGAKYDFEVVPAEAVFKIHIDLENPTEDELALVQAGLVEWEGGFRLGGFTSRGLGQVKLVRTETEWVDYLDPNHLREFLLQRKMQPAGDMLKDSLEKKLSHGGGHA